MRKSRRIEIVEGFQLWPFNDSVVNLHPCQIICIISRSLTYIAVYLHPCQILCTISQSLNDSVGYIYLCTISRSLKDSAGYLNDSVWLLHPFTNFIKVSLFAWPDLTPLAGFLVISRLKKPAQLAFLWEGKNVWLGKGGILGMGK